MFRRLTIFGALMCCISIGFGQIDSVTMNTVDITLRGSVEHNVDSFNYSLVGLSTLEQFSFDHRLTVQPNSGPGLATLSVRGGNSEQVLIRWNGISLQNNLNGSFDAQLAPPAMLHKVDVNSPQSGSSGGGGLTGNIDINTHLSDTSSKLGALYSYGTYTYKMGLKLSVFDSVNTMLVYAESETQNYDFTYPSALIPGKTDTLSHSNARKDQALVSYKRKLKYGKPVEINAWYIQMNREIPPTMLENRSAKLQHDKALRLQSSWGIGNKRHALNVNVGQVNEWLNYQDSLSLIDANYRVSNQTVMLHYLYAKRKNLTLGVDAETRTYGAEASERYKAFRLEQSEAFHINYSKQLLSGFKAHVGLRAVQYSDNEDFPILFDATGLLKLSPQMVVTAKANSNYRMPTFNMLYWQPGGNPNLVSETSVAGEIALHLTTNYYNSEIVYYQNQIANALRWLPDGSGLFSAQQIIGQHQQTRGMELIQKLLFKGFALQSGITLQQAIITETGKQVALIPALQGNATLHYKHSEHLRAYYTLRYWGERYSDNANTEKLDDILLHGLGLAANYDPFRFDINCSNVANTFYTFLPYRPNTPRNIQFTLSYNL